MLSYGIVGGSVSLKLPQIFKIFGAGSTKGVSSVTTVMEIFMFATSFCYGVVKEMPIETFAENGICGVQCAVLFLMLMYYNGNLFSPLYLLILITLGVYSWAFYTGIFTSIEVSGIPLYMLFYFAVVPMGALSKVPQIMAFHSAKSTGSAAFLTWFLNFGGSAARIFTTISQVGDPVMTAAYVINAVLGGIIILQFFMYWNSGDEKKKQ